MQTDKIIAALESAWEEDSFIRLTLNHYGGKEKDLKKIIARKLVIKDVEKMSFTCRYKTRDIVKNYSMTEARDILLAGLAQDWTHVVLQTAHHDYICEIKGKKTLFRQAPPSAKEKPSASHDRAKKRLVTAQAKSWMAGLNLADASGKIYPTASDKFRQINKFIETCAALLKEVAFTGSISVVDMGSGKGYLTFALYDYLRNTLRVEAKVTGVELRPDLVDLCNRVARDAGFADLSFKAGSINDTPVDDADILIALHACDTATDDAIAKGIKAGSKLILCAPCCHKQIRREMEQAITPDDLAFMMRYGTYREQIAEMATDAMRALILEAHGYKVKVFEFISDEHTPKNVMITALKTGSHAARQEKARAELRAAKEYFGVKTHYLETLLADDGEKAHH